MIDVAAVGPRALLSCAAPPGSGYTCTTTSVDVQGLGEGARPVLGRARRGDQQQEAMPLLAVHSYADAGGCLQASVVVLNATAGALHEGGLAAALLGLLLGEEEAAAGGPQQAPPSADAHSNGGPAGSSGSGRTVYVAAAVHLPQGKDTDLFVYCMNSGVVPAVLPPHKVLAAPTRIRDGVLACLLHVLRVSGTPTCCLLVPGNKPPASSNDPLLTDSVPACNVLGQAAAAVAGLQYDPACLGSVASMYRWYAQQAQQVSGSEVMYA